MEIEKKNVMLTVNQQTLPGELAKLEAEGWMINPDIAPVAIYHLVRIKQNDAPETEMGGRLGVALDETKIGILRRVNGQLMSVGANGELTPVE